MLVTIIALFRLILALILKVSFKFHIQLDYLSHCKSKSHNAHFFRNLQCRMETETKSLFETKEFYVISFLKCNSSRMRLNFLRDLIL